jgi:integrase
LTLREPLGLPVEVIKFDGLPKVFAGNLPVTPMNAVLRLKRDDRGATDASLETYAHAALLYVEFAAHRGRSLIDVTNEEFRWFVQALKGECFPDAADKQRQLRGTRCPRTADKIIALLYSMAADVKELYGVRFDWYRYRGVEIELVELVRASRGKSGRNLFQRAHRVPFTPRKVLGLPDEEFERLLRAAYEKWGETVVDGDAAFAKDPEAQRGALFYRNLVILLILRLEGGRRGELPYITLEDIDREKRRINLVTKGHGGERGKRLPVLLHPLVESAIWVYVTEHRPRTDENSVKGYPILVSHSTRNYGERISAQCIRKVVDALSDALTAPWDELVSPHPLRHSFARDLQEHGGDVATTVNMRHASNRSLNSYFAGPEIFAGQLLASGETKLTRLLSEFGIGDSMWENT